VISNVTLGQYFPGTSVIHRLDPRLKLVLTIAMIALIFFVHTFYGYLSIFVLFLLVTLLSGVSIKYVLKGIKPMRFVILLTTIMNVFFLKGETLLFEWAFIHVYKEALIRAAELAIRLILLVLTSTLLTLTTSPKEITDAIERLMKPLRKIKVPVHEIALMMSIALRFIPTLMEETDRIMKAQTARGASFDTGSFLSRAKDMIPVLVPLFVSAFKRAEELALAMEARCYHGGENRTQLKVFKMQGRDYLAILIFGLQVAAIAFGL
jgi:energy-coupling factor transport system permease protein